VNEKGSLFEHKYGQNVVRDEEDGRPVDPGREDEAGQQWARVEELSHPKVSRPRKIVMKTAFPAMARNSAELADRAGNGPEFRAHV
jgi:hypothetical protein